jgi:hypothetical protein
MDSSPDLSQVLADARGEAAVLRANRASFSVERVEEFCERVDEAARDYIRWISESDAMIKSGLSGRTLRRRFRELLECGLARYDAEGEREYRACAIPPRASIGEQRDRGRKAVA